MRYGGFNYIDLKYKPRESDLICTFRVEPNGVPFNTAAMHVAGESSVGTWTKVTTLTRSVVDKRARVFYIKKPYIKIAYPIELFEKGNMPQVLSSIAGNVFGMKTVKNLRLEDVIFPRELIKSFKGPRYGIKGVRRITRIKDRPLIGTIVKPKLGLSSEQHAKVAYEAWVGGCDIVKDDENLTNQSFNTFRKRLKLTMKMKEKAEKETGEVKVYLPNVTAETFELLKREKLVEESGNKFVMVDILTAGFSALQTLRNNTKLAIHGHRAMHAALTRNKKHGISMKVIAKVARLIGVDQLHIGTAVGKMEGSKKEILDIKKALEEDIGIKKTLSVASGGLHPGMVPKLMKMFGIDVIIQAGGGIHGHPKGTRAGATAMRQAVDAVLKGVSLKEYAKTHKELRLALENWK